MRENRRAPRKRVREWGKIIAGDGRTIQNCTIADISATGARLVIGTAEPPDEFYLYRKADHTLWGAVVVRWSYQSVGVRLSAPLDPASEKARALLSVLDPPDAPAA